MAWTLVAALLGQAAADPASRALANATAGSIWRVSVLWLRDQLESATQLEDIVVGGHQWCRAHVPDDSWSLSLGPQHLDSKPLAEAARAAFVPRQDGLLVKLSKKTTAMVWCRGSSSVSFWPGVDLQPLLAPCREANESQNGSQVESLWT